jgi:hypothetical protein
MPAPTSPKIPIPKVQLDSSSSRKEAPVARFAFTPLLLRAVPERVVVGNWPKIDRAWIVDSSWMSGSNNMEPSRNS